jgi:hypothetical protein
VETQPTLTDRPNQAEGLFVRDVYVLDLTICGHRFLLQEWTQTAEDSNIALFKTILEED